MPLSTFVFYCGNLILLGAYVVLALLNQRPGGVTGVQQTSRALQLAGTAFFWLAALLHADMAVHTIAHVPFFDNGGHRITWDFAGIVFAKMLTIVLALAVIARDSRRRRSRRGGRHTQP